MCILHVHVHVHMHIVCTHVYVQYAKVSLDEAHLGKLFSRRALQADIACRRVGQHKAKVNVQPDLSIMKQSLLLHIAVYVHKNSLASPPSGTTGA